MLIRNRNITELAFYYWVKNHPLSGHSLDRDRFVGFVLAAREYRSKKFNTYEKFKQEILAYRQDFREEDYQYFWDEKCRIENFLDELAYAEYPLPIDTVHNDDLLRYVQRNIIDHQLIETELTEKEFEHGISVSEVRKRHKGRQSTK